MGVAHHLVDAEVRSIVSMLARGDRLRRIITFEVIANGVVVQANA
jgi:hypothetical protein